MDIFNMFFGGGGRMQRERRGKIFMTVIQVLCLQVRILFSNTRCMYAFSVGKNVVHQLSVSLEEMYKGATRKLGLQKNVICEKCEGMQCVCFIP